MYPANKKKCGFGVLRFGQAAGLYCIGLKQISKVF
jgi:hypothetical protein